MPLYMDLHNIPSEATLRDLAMAHARDLEIQWKYGVKYSRYWFDPDQGKAFCLVEAPNVDAAVAVHREGSGFVADKIIPVAEVSVEEMLGAFEGESHPWEPDSGEDPPPAESAFRTILFTDMEGSTALTQRLGDEGAMRLLRTHDSIIREALSAHGGGEVKHTGDGIMASFSSVARAVECSIAAQRALAAYNQENPEVTLRVRMGLSAGEPVTEHDDLFGAAVQQAARVCAHADPDCTLVSNVVRDLCIGKQLPFLDRGEAALKGFQDPVRVYEVPWR
jgi:class 3 adenylate cyclase